MAPLKIGIRLDSLKLPLRRALLEAEKLGVAGVQVEAVGDLSPQGLTQTGRREFRHLLRAHNLELCALGCPLRRGLDVAEGQQERIDHLREVLSLSYDLGPRIVVVQAGRISKEETDPRAFLMTEALLALGHHGDRVGSKLALETGLEPGDQLAAYLNRLDTGGLGVNLDPANLLMSGFDPYASARALHGKVVHTHAKDARTAKANRAAQEVPLGHGDIDWFSYLGVLQEIDYHGYLTIERETGDDPLAEVAAGVGFLRRFVG